MKRYLQQNIINDLEKKMVFITGPRQVGKTYLSKQIMNQFEFSQYLNFDSTTDRTIILNERWKSNSQLIILDEIHKMKNWKKFLKGVFDTRVEQQKFLITGSARMETFRQSGDSLAGRYFHYHLLPLSVKELEGTQSPFGVIENLNKLGGFPEAFLSGSEVYRARWEKQYYTDLIREDILDFSKIHEIKMMKVLVELLRKRIGSPLSFRGLATDLQISPNTVQNYISILESLYIIFLIHPYHKNISRAILREPKVYFYDTGYIIGDEGIKLENTCAVSLLKHVRFLQDSEGKNIQLNYIRTKERKEVDFVLTDNDYISQMIEIKLSDDHISSTLKYFKEKIPDATAVQLVHNLKQEYEHNDIMVMKAGEWLAALSA